MGIKKGPDGEWIVNPDETEVVKKIYSLACNGKGCNQIAQILNEKNIPGPTGKTWIARSIIVLLTNPAYIGDTLYQKTYRDEQFRQVKNHGELDQYYEERSGMLLFCFFTVGIGILCDWTYEKTGSIWLPSLMHGAINAAPGIPLLVCSVEAKRLLGPAPNGVIGGTGIVVVGVWILVKGEKNR